MHKIEIIDGDNYLEEIKALIKEYTTSLGRDLSFQSLDDEIKNLSSKYSGDNGRSLVLLVDGVVMGCVAYHKLSENCCEMKRLYVKPEARGLRSGEKLIEAITDIARENGFKEMMLDTITPLEAAIHLYKKCGFVETDPYYHNPMADVIYMRKKL